MKVKSIDYLSFFSFLVGPLIIILVHTIFKQEKTVITSNLLRSLILFNQECVCFVPIIAWPWKLPAVCIHFHGCVYPMIWFSHSLGMFLILTASKAHQYAAATERAWGYEWWARSPHVPFLPPYASPGSITGSNALGSAETQRAAVSPHDAASATETGQYQHTPVSLDWNRCTDVISILYSIFLLIRFYMWFCFLFNTFVPVNVGNKLKLNANVIV